jgi:Cytochrome P460
MDGGAIVRAYLILGLCLSGVVATVAAASQGWADTAAGQDAMHFAEVVHSPGNMRVPANYRETYQFMDWVVAADGGQGSKELHVVYAPPGNAETYRKSGHFADGAALVKEVFKASTKDMTTGTVSHADTLKGGL